MTILTEAQREAEVCPSWSDMEAAVGRNVDLTKFLVLDKSKAKVKWKCPQYAVKMLEEGAHADIAFEVGKSGSVIFQVPKDSSVKAHRSVLASVSPVFAAMFQHDMKEKTTSIVRISDMTIDALKLLLLLLYTTKDESDDGMPELNDAVDKHLKELHHAIKKYQLESILGSVYMSALQRNLDPDNCWTYLESNDVRSTPFDTCYKYILGHYEEVINSESFTDAMKQIPEIVSLVLKRACSEATRGRPTISATKRLRIDK